MHVDPTSPLFAPAWPEGEPSPMRDMLITSYIDSHAAPSRFAPERAAVIAHRVMTFDHEMRQRTRCADETPERFATPDPVAHDRAWSTAHVIAQFDAAGGTIPGAWIDAEWDARMTELERVQPDCPRCGFYVPCERHADVDECDPLECDVCAFALNEDTGN